MMTISSPAKIYALAVACTGLGLLAVELANLPTPATGVAAILIAFATITEFVSVCVSNGPAVSLGIGPILAALIVGDPALAACTGAASSAIHGLFRHGYRNVKWLFNAGNYAISAVVAGNVYRRLATGGTPPYDVPKIWPLVIYVGVFCALNYLLVWAMVALEDSTRWKTLGDTARLDLLSYAVGVPSGIGAGIAYRQEGLGPFLVFMGLMLLAAYLVKESQQAGYQSLEMSVLYEVALLVNSSLDLETLMRELRTAVRRLVDFSHIWLLLREECTGELSPVGEPPVNGECSVVQALQPVLSRCVETRRCVVEDDTRVPMARSVLAVPLMWDGRVQGVLMLGHQSTGKFIPQHARLMTVLSSQVSVAVHNALKYRRVQRLAMTDPMTGLCNYRFLKSILADQIRSAAVNGCRFSVLLIDLDNFREVNNRFGHLAGDEVLRQIAAAIREAVRESDIPSRYAGDEFVIVLPGAMRDEASRVAARVKTAVESRDFLLPDGSAIRVGVSVGVATYPDDGLTESELIDAADRAMYRAKTDSKLSEVSQESYGED